MPTRLIDSLGITDEFAALFGDRAVLAAMHEFELALAKAQAKLNLIPVSAAIKIAQSQVPDAGDLASEARKHATLAIPFTQALAKAVGLPAAEFVHFGATSQDLLDTTLVLLIRGAQAVLCRDHHHLGTALHELSEKHAATVMMARTLLQPAPPITFGYKVAGWYGAVQRNWQRLTQAFEEGLVLQFGGASGTLASYGDQGPALAAALGGELQLKVPDAPWHAHRDRMASIVTNCGIYAGTLGKIARDVSLLMKFEVGEASEPGGGSSAMPHKRNPAGCTLVLAAATRIPALVSAYLSGMVQEHERGVGGMQAEWQTVSAVIEATGSALTTMADTIETLTVNPDRMRANITSMIYSEKAAVRLKEQLGRDLQPEDYLGPAEHFRRRLLEEK